MTLDLVTGLPPSEGNTTIITIVDWFSKAVHLLALRKLPFAKEMAKLLLLHVFRLQVNPLM